jgi:hypothetical protein
MKVMIFEPNIEGHHFPFLARLVSAINDLGLSPVLVLDRRAPASEMYRQYLTPISRNFILDACIEPMSFSPATGLRELLPQFFRSLNRHQPEHTYIPSADIIFPWLVMACATRAFRLAPGLEIETVLVHGRALASRPGISQKRRFLDSVARLAAAKSPSVTLQVKRVLM